MAGRGKPRKFQDPQALQKAIDEWFDSITYFEDAYVMIEDRVEKGKMYYKKDFLMDVNGKQIVLKKFAEPPTLFKLCAMLECDRDTLLDYRKTAPPEFVEIVKNARDRIFQYHEDQLHNKNAATGSMFHLKCNNKWIDRQYVDTRTVNLNVEAELESFIKLSPEEQTKFIDDLSRKAKEDIHKEEKQNPTL